MCSRVCLCVYVGAGDVIVVVVMVMVRPPTHHPFVLRISTKAAWVPSRTNTPNQNQTQEDHVHLDHAILTSVHLTNSGSSQFKVQTLPSLPSFLMVMVSPLTHHPFVLRVSTKAEWVHSRTNNQNQNQTQEDHLHLDLAIPTSVHLTNSGSSQFKVLNGHRHSAGYVFAKT